MSSFSKLRVISGRVLGLRFWVLVSALAIAACGGGGGGGGGGGEGNNAAPTISALSYSPKAAYVGSGGGSVLVTGQFTVSTNGSTLSTVTLRVLDVSGAVITSNAIPVQGGFVGTGVLSGIVTAFTTTLGNYTFEVFATNTSGVASNVLTSTFRVSNFPWTSTRAMPTPRGNVSVATIGSKLFVMGGSLVPATSIPAPFVSTMEVYDAATDSWSSAASLPMPMAAIVSAVINSKIYLFGAAQGPYSTDCAALGNVYIFDPANNTWAVGASIPAPTDASGTVVVGSTVYIIGGQAGVPCSSLSNVTTYDSSNGTWSTAASMPLPFMNLGAGSFAGQIYAFGGLGVDIHNAFSEVALKLGEYEPLSNAWTQFDYQNPAMTPANVSVDEVNGLFYLTGGSIQGSSISGNVAYDPLSNKTVQKEPVPSGVFVGVRDSGVYNGVIYHFLPTGTWKYNPADDIN